MHEREALQDSQHCEAELPELTWETGALLPRPTSTPRPVIQFHFLQFQLLMVNCGSKTIK